MLHALADARSRRPVWWLHAARDRLHHPLRRRDTRLAGTTAEQPCPHLVQPSA
ncbi:hypothetical protein [Streptomyces sp. NPDC051636]|uniref:hypothetical protein n=1 Tax=Streptomyces sp. NPDC051636 TaxID=3365663 RepID=UPI00378C8895